MREVTGEDTWRKEISGGGQEMRYNGHVFSGRLTWKGAGHMVGGEWMMRWGRDHMDQKRGDGKMLEDEEGAKGSEPHRTVR